MSLFRLTKLQHFCAVAEHASIGLAAKVLNVSQPALTRSIQRLESEIGEPLFDRNARGVTPTWLGETLLPHARAILAEADRAAEDLHNLKGKRRARIKLGISPNFLGYVIPDVLQDFVTQYPEASIEVQTGTAEQLLALLAGAQIDLAVAMVWRAAMDVKLGKVMNISQTPIARLTAGVYAPADHPLASADTVALEELSLQRWAVPYSLSLSYIFQNVFNDHDLNVPLQILNTSHLPLMVRTCLRLNLLTIVPRHVVADEVAQGAMVAIACPPLELDYSVSLLSRRRDTSTTALNDFAATLKSRFSQHESRTGTVG